MQPEDPDIVWDTVHEDLPPLITAIKEVLSKNQPG